MKIIHFADLHLGVESYGRIDPASGLSSRFHDFLATFDKLVDYAVEKKVDLVLFCGDAFKSRDPSQTQQREFARRIKRLSENGTSVFLLIGNHDLPNAVGRATTTEIYDTLAVENVYVADRPITHRVKTKNGTIQITALPWLRRSVLLSKDDAKNLNFEQLNQKMQGVLTQLIKTEAEKLDPALPSILAAHVWVSGSRIGSEDTMTIGQEQVLLPSNVANAAFDYIALGHIHRHQVLNETPPMTYAGSLERLDFGDEKDDKGFYLVEIKTDKKTGCRKVSYKFHKLEGRRFITIKSDIKPDDTDPTASVLEAIGKQDTEDAIVRLHISLSQESEGQIIDSQIRIALKEAYYFTVSRDIKRQSRVRLGDHSAEEITPVEALRAYIEDKKFSRSYSKTLLKYGKELIKERLSGEPL
ncbi:exonuclease SbcCD subunit D [Chloroflexota bacterium]